MAESQNLEQIVDNTEQTNSISKNSSNIKDLYQMRPELPLSKPEERQEPIDFNSLNYDTHTPLEEEDKVQDIYKDESEVPEPKQEKTPAKVVETDFSEKVQKPEPQKETPKPQEPSYKSFYQTLQNNIKTLRFISDVKNLGVSQNLSGLESIVKHTEKTLDPKNSVVVLGGDVMYDFHVNNSRHYDIQQLYYENLALFSEEKQKEIENSNLNFQEKLQRMAPLLAHSYLKESNSILKEFAKKYAVGKIFGNNEHYAIQTIQKGDKRLQMLNQQGLVEELNGYTIDSGEPLFINPFFKINGITAFSDEYFNENRNEIEFDENRQKIERSHLYDKLSHLNPRLILLHGAPSYFTQSGAKEHIGDEEAMNKYLNEYDGDEPLVVMAGHDGKQGIYRKKNAKGKDIILFNSNNDVSGNKTKGVIYDLHFEGEKIAGFTETNYTIKDDATYQKYVDAA